ncbi:MAG TPA: hypothetical protein VK879_11690 [Candidatus Sulfomarinibacteraceae bacterium]|nr:hypothetical protein [Candidatus Sulfomarinibacteraceae bacterium]
MDRTVPSRENDEIALYIRTYYSLLRSTSEVEIRTLIEAHTRINSALHVGATKPDPDMAAFIYAILRMPSYCIADVRLVVMGQSEAVFEEKGFADVESWQLVNAPARRRRYFYDGDETVAVYIASRSDIDDLIPTLTAYQIEREKLHHILHRPRALKFLREHCDAPIDSRLLQDLSELSNVAVDDLDRLHRIWGSKLVANLLHIAERDLHISVRLLSGSLTDYRRATRRWWQNVARTASDARFEDRPVYFVSSNTHSLANLLSGFALQQEDSLVEFIQSEGSLLLQQEYDDILARNVPSSRENFLYYTLKKYEQRYAEVEKQRIGCERSAGITRIPSRHVFDVEVQVMELNQVRTDDLDPRLQMEGIERLRESDALIINIDFPLGMAAYQILSEVARNIASIRGVFIMGKAATLNARIGDVMIPNVVHDEQSLNTYLFENRFTAADVAPLLTYGTVLDNQKAITVRGTFLQNRDYMSVFYQEGYTDMEMEAGPFLSSIYEMIRPQRYPHDEIANLYASPFPIGILHYASDTPFSKGKNLGAQNLSYFGMDPTYASATAILQAILREELRHGRR